jgi:hypothetical protein
VSKIDMSKLLKREINGDFGRSLGLEAIAELESMETNSGARIGALSDRTHEIFARHWFHYLAHTFRHELKIDGPMFRLYTAMRLEIGFDEVVDVVRDEGNKLREHIDQAVARLHAHARRRC